ncbi:EamA-like transporter family protein [Labrenzia sp. THAF191b]|jgi:drug/metabolite transporter (DMT)-like permease|uniref:DMT family transporter n=1 Tax=unclassified Labrenzia TaxID=2648686 RepID=UPI0012678E85|nr:MULTISPECIES: DMT family transporter [unclassified Labrenzia]QFS97824.1 EamA-like transporter family protein [Labrenzia sp. THAF191b]QFT04139.1 EamA-like transporter family protein [Labrenzia sp. THAF191a]QFT15681.1 EamA-like transporter family protein [Labrenzia sp. THAF187b]
MAHDSQHRSTGNAAAATAPLAGIGLIVLACLSFSVLDATAKYMSASLPTLQIVWMRFVSHVILSLVLFQVWKKPSLLKTNRPVLQIVRSFCLLGTTIFNFLAVRYLQLAETMSIMFAAPFVITALAGPLLGEWAGLRRWIAIIVGFIGVLVVTRPGLGGMHWAAIYSVAAMSFYAVYALLTRQLTATDSSAGMLIISGIVAAIAMAPAGISVWVTPPDVWTWVLLFATGAFGAGGHFLFIMAHRIAPAPVLAPFIYTQIVWMIALGFLIFDDVPTYTTILGAAIVVASGLYILYRERVKGI